MNTQISVKALEVKRLLTSAASEMRDAEGGATASILLLRQMSSMVDDLLDAIHGEEISTLKETILQIPEARWNRLDSEWVELLSSDYVRLKICGWLMDQCQSRGLPILQAWQHAVDTNQLIAESRGG